MNIDLLVRLEGAFRTRNFPDDLSFNLCYGKKTFNSGDLKPDADGDLYDRHMEVKMHVNGSKVQPDWCGSVCCVAGLALALFDPEVYASDFAVGPPLVLAQRLLDLTDKQAEELFTPAIDDWERVTPEQAADAIGFLILTGDVVWN